MTAHAENERENAQLRRPVAEVQAGRPALFLGELVGQRDDGFQVRGLRQLPDLLPAAARAIEVLEAEGLQSTAAQLRAALAGEAARC